MNEKIYFARYVRRCLAEHWLRKHQTVDKGSGRSKQGAVSTSDFQEIWSIGIGQLLILLQHWRGYTRPLALDAADNLPRYHGLHGDGVEHYRHGPVIDRG